MTDTRKNRLLRTMLFSGLGIFACLLLGNYTNSVIRNVLGGIAAVATLGLAIRALYNLITTLAK